MPTLTRPIILLAAILFHSFQLFGQLLMPDVARVGECKTYWVDSTQSQGFSYIWAIDGKIVQSGPVCGFVHLWNLEGIFGLSIMKVQPDGCIGEPISGIVTVSPANPVSVSLTVSENGICAGLSVTFTAIPVNQGTGPLYTWFLNGAFVKEGMADTFSYLPANGDEVFVVLLSDLPEASGNPARSGTIMMRVLPAPLLRITNPPPVCSPLTINLTDSSITMGSGASLLFSYWMDDAGKRAISDPAAVGMGTYYIMASTVENCYVVQSVEVTESPPIGIPVFAKGSESIRFSAKETVLYAATSTNSLNIIYLLDSTSLAGGCTINPLTSEVTFLDSWIGYSTVTTVANGCQGPATAGHSVFTASNLPEISWGNPADIVYGTTLSDLQLNASSNIPGLFLYDPGVGTVLKAGHGQDLTVKFFPMDSINYKTAIKAIKINVLIMPIDVYADGVSKIIGSADPDLTFQSVPQLVPGDFYTGVLQRAPGETIGKYRISIGSLMAGLNYRLNFYSNDFNILELPARPITLTASAGQNKIVGTPDPPLFTYYLNNPLDTGDQLSGALSREPGDTIGNYPITEGTISGGKKYSVIFRSNNFSIIEAPAKTITVTVDPGQSKGFMEADPVFTYRVSPPLVPGDILSGNLSREPGESVGNYPINQGDLSGGKKYDIKLISCDFRIFQRITKQITVSADAGQSKPYGDTDPVISYTINPDNDSAVFTGRLERVVGETVAGGPYRIYMGTLSAGTGYSITFIPAEFSISPLPITVTADEKSKISGQPDPEYTYTTVPELLKGDAFSGSLIRSPGENPGVYIIKQGTLTAGNNYLMSYEKNQLTITGENIQVITVTPVRGQWKVYGDKDSLFLYTVYPLLDTSDLFTGELTRTPGSNAGNYLITIGSLSAGPEYFLKYEPEYFTINRAPLIIKADNQTIKSGEPIPALTYNCIGFKNGDISPEVLPTISTTAISGSPPGIYPIVVSGAADPNYDILNMEGELNITRIVLAPEITWDSPAAIIYGTPLSGLHLNATANISGLWEYMPKIGTMLNAGLNQPLMAKFFPEDTVWYAAESKFVTISVFPKPVTIIVDSGQHKVFGQPDPDFGYSVFPELITGGSLTGKLVRTPGEMPGKYPITQGTLSAGANYEITFVPEFFTITAIQLKQITVTVSAFQSKIYGDPDPEFTYSYLPEFEDSSKFTGALSRDPGERTGNYPIHQGTLAADSGYLIVFVPNDLTITAKPIMIKAVARSKSYDGTIFSDGSPTISPGLVPGDTSGFFQVFDNKNTGIRKTIIPKGKVTCDFGENNYSITYITIDEGIIKPSFLPVHFTIDDKVYDGTIAATILTSQTDVGIPGDSVSIAGGDAQFDTPDAGTLKRVTVSRYTLIGANAINYFTDNIAISSARITPLSLVASLSVNEILFSQLTDQLTITATIQGGASREGGLPAAASATFTFEGNPLTNELGNPETLFQEKGADLASALTVPLNGLTGSGTLIAGLKELVVTLNDISNNYIVEPNPARVAFTFSPAFDFKIYPNPLSGPDLLFQVILPVGDEVSIDLFASNGQKILRIFEGYMPMGEARIIRYEHNLAQGTYLYRISANNQSFCGRIVVIRVY